MAVRMLSYGREVYSEVKRCARPSFKGSLMNLAFILVSFPLLGMFALVVRMLTMVMRDFVLSL